MAGKPGRPDDAAMKRLAILAFAEAGPEVRDVLTIITDLLVAIEARLDSSETVAVEAEDRINAQVFKLTTITDDIGSVSDRLAALEAAK